MTLYILQYHTFKTLRGEVKHNFRDTNRKVQTSKQDILLLSICAPKNLNNPLTPG
jgi:hypothetical protein